jgi:hypothetical protein
MSEGWCKCVGHRYKGAVLKYFIFAGTTLKGEFLVFSWLGLPMNSNRICTSLLDPIIVPLAEYL